MLSDSDEDDDGVNFFYRDEYWGSDTDYSLDYDSDYYYYDNDSDGETSYSSDFSEKFHSGEFYGFCHRPSLFPDSKEFPVEYARRISKIRAAQRLPLEHAAASYSIMERLNYPIFEELWECLLYLKEIISVALERDDAAIQKPDISTGVADIWKNSMSCTSVLGKSTYDLCSNFFVWCNDHLIDTLQLLIPFKIPFNVWETIVLHLSKDVTSKNKALFTNLGITSIGDKAQIFERLLIRKCILKCTDIVRVFYCGLYASFFDPNNELLKGKIIVLLSEFKSSMECYISFADGIESLTNVSIHHANRNNLSLYIDDHFDPCQDEFDLFKIVGASTGYQNDSQHFTLFIADNEIPIEKDAYHIMCIDKNCVDAAENVSFIYVPEALFSERPPLIFTCSGLVAAIGFRTGYKTLTVWDFSDKGPFEGQGEKIFSSYIEKVAWGNNDSGFNSSLFKEGDVSIAGMVKLENKLKVMFRILPACGVTPSCVIGEFFLNESSYNFSFFKEKPLHLYFENSKPLGIHQNMAFVLHLGTQNLCVYDIYQQKEVVIAETKFECGKDWQIQFDSKPDSKSLILYNGPNIEIWNLDEDLVRVDAFSIALHLPSPSDDSFEFQLYGNILYGFLNHQDHLHTVSSDFSDLSDEYYESYLRRRFANAHMVHFFVDMRSEEKEVCYLDFESNYLESEGIDMDISEWACNAIQLCLSGFNKRGELIWLSMEVNFEDIYRSSNGKLNAPCLSVQFATVQFYESMQDMEKSMLPDVEKILCLQKSELARTKRKENSHKEAEKQIRLKEARKSAEDKRRLRKWQHMIHADKERKAAAYLQGSFSGDTDVSGDDTDDDFDADDDDDKDDDTSDGDETTDGDSSVVNLSRQIADGTFFTSKIDKWFPDRHYGFSEVLCNNKVQSVFIHESNIGNRKDKEIRTNGLIQFQLKWNKKYPRPNAINANLL